MALRRAHRIEMPLATAVETDQNTTITPSPVREDGSSWPFALLIGEETVYADTLTELVAHIIPGYADFAGDEDGHVLAFLARVDLAAGVASQAQAVVLAEATKSGEFIAEEESEDVLTILLSQRGSSLIDGSPFGNRWDHPVPLVLVSTDFAPFSEHELIDGNVQYFNPGDERVFLESLQAFGFVGLFVNAAL